MIYIEYLLLINVFIHVVLIYGICFMIGERIKIRWVILSSIVDMIYMFFYIKYPELLSIIKYPFGIFISIISFIDTSKIIKIKGVILYYLLNILLGGASSVLYFAITFRYYMVLILLGLIFIMIWIYKYYFKVSIDYNSLIYDVLVIDDKKKYHFKCYLDTGNFLKSDDLINILVLNKKYHIGKYKSTIDVCSIGGDKLEIYRVDKVFIRINKRFVQRSAYITYLNFPFDGLFGVGLLGG